MRHFLSLVIVHSSMKWPLYSPVRPENDSAVRSCSQQHGSESTCVKWNTRLYTHTPNNMSIFISHCRLILPIVIMSFFSLYINISFWSCVLLEVLIIKKILESSECSFTFPHGAAGLQWFQRKHTHTHFK